MPKQWFALTRCKPAGLLGLLLCSTGLAVSMGGPYLLHAQPNKFVRFSALKLSARKDVARPSAMAIVNDQQWKEFLDQILGHTGSPPGVDFRKQMVVAIFAGEKPTGGYSIAVQKIADESQAGKPSRASVHYQVAAPPADAMVTQALTYPYVVIRLEGKFDTVEFSPPLPAR